MAEGVDLDQPAEVSWWPESELPEIRITRQTTLRRAINFVKTDLSEAERSTARIDFDSPLHCLDYSKPEELQENAAAMGIDLGQVLDVFVDAEAGTITVTLPSTGYSAVYKKSSKLSVMAPLGLSDIENKSAPMPLKEFHSRAQVEVFERARKLRWVR